MHPILFLIYPFDYLVLISLLDALNPSRHILSRHVRYAQTSIHVYGMLSDLVTSHTSTFVFLKALFSFLSLIGDRTRTKELIVGFAFFFTPQCYLETTRVRHERQANGARTFKRERVDPTGVAFRNDAVCTRVARIWEGVKSKLNYKSFYNLC